MQEEQKATFAHRPGAPRERAREHRRREINTLFAGKVRRCRKRRGEKEDAAAAAAGVFLFLLYFTCSLHGARL